MLASRELQIMLTSRNREKGQPIPMCGVPYHARTVYVAKLIRAGFKIAICDQMEQPGPGKKIVRREVVRVITPGTATDVAVLDARENNFLAAVAKHASGSRSAWPTSISPPVNSKPPSFPVRGPTKICATSCNSSIRANAAAPPAATF